MYQTNCNCTITLTRQSKAIFSAQRGRDLFLSGGIHVHVILEISQPRMYRTGSFGQIGVYRLKVRDQ